MINNPLLKKTKDRLFFWPTIIIAVFLLGLVIIGRFDFVQKMLVAQENSPNNNNIAHILFIDNSNPNNNVLVVGLYPSSASADHQPPNLLLKIPIGRRQELDQSFIEKKLKPYLAQQGYPVKKITIAPYLKVQDQAAANSGQLCVFVVDIRQPPKTPILPSVYQLAVNDPNPHERAHGKMAAAEYYFPQLGKRGKFLYIGENKNGQWLFLWLPHPNPRVNSITKLVLQRIMPSFFYNFSRVNFYIGKAGQRFGMGLNATDLGYYADEFAAYIAGGAYRLNLYLQGYTQSKDGFPLTAAGITEGIVDFMIIEAAIIDYLRHNDPEYYKNPYVRSVFKEMYRRGMAVINKAEKANLPSSGDHTREGLRLLREDPRAESMRTALRGMFGAGWTKEVLGF